MTVRKVRNVLFDLDGTLADTAPDLAYALNTLLQENGKTALPLETIKPAVSLGGNAMIRLAFEIDEKHPNFEALRNRFLELYRDNIARQTILFDGMESVLDTLDGKQFSWGIVTNKSTWLTQALMDALALSERTPSIVCGDTVAHSKPHPAPMLYACELLQCEPADTLYVGDARRDIEAGKRAGMITLLANYGYIDSHDKPETWGADGEVNTPLEILDWVIRD